MSPFLDANNRSPANAGLEVRVVQTGKLEGLAHVRSIYRISGLQPYRGVRLHRQQSESGTLDSTQLGRCRRHHDLDR